MLFAIICEGTQICAHIYAQMLQYCSCMSITFSVSLCLLLAYAYLKYVPKIFTNISLFTIKLIGAELGI